MAVDTGKIVRGMAHFMDEEMLPQMTGMPKVLGGVGMGMFLNNAQHSLEAYKDKEWAKMIGLIDDRGEYCVEQVYEELLKQVRREPIVFDVPVIGRITMREQDVSRLYQHIMNA